MLNKEVLLFNLEKDLEFTHTITVGTNKYYAGYYAEGAAFGDITPKGAFDGYIMDLTSRVNFDKPSTTFQIDAFLGANQVYLGRTDTKKIVLLDQLDSSSGLAEGWGDFFTADDIGKKIKIWIGENPPPWA